MRLALLLVLVLRAAALAPCAQEPQPIPPAPTPGTAPPQPAAPSQQPPSQPPPAQIRSLSVVVLDAAHGGTDGGARGANGIIESEVVLNLAQQLRAELERQGFRVVYTRQGNENPTFDDRSAVANRQRNAVFISLHVSSVGTPGTVRAYSMPATASAGPRSALLAWDQAQGPYAEMSRRMAELVQVQLALRFRGSLEVPAYAPVRQLRTVAEPAIAIEVSSVSVAQRSRLDQMAAPLADAVARALAAFRPLYEAGAK